MQAALHSLTHFCRSARELLWRRCIWQRRVTPHRSFVAKSLKTGSVCWPHIPGSSAILPSIRSILGLGWWASSCTWWGIRCSSACCYGASRKRSSGQTRAPSPHLAGYVLQFAFMPNEWIVQSGLISAVGRSGVRFFPGRFVLLRPTHHPAVKPSCLGCEHDASRRCQRSQLCHEPRSACLPSVCC